MAGEDLSVGAFGTLVLGEVQEAGVSDLSRADPGPTDSAVAVGSGESAVGSGLESLTKKVGSALVSGSSEPLNQIQAYDEEKIEKCSFSAVAVAAATDSVPDSVPAPAAAPAAPGLPVEMPAPAPAPAPVLAPAQLEAGDLTPGPVRARASAQCAHSVPAAAAVTAATATFIQQQQCQCQQ